jgi:hypothetical protein
MGGERRIRVSVRELRSLVSKALLREAGDLSVKPGELIARLRRINERLGSAGVGGRVGLVVDREPAGHVRLAFGLDIGQGETVDLTMIGSLAGIVREGELPGAPGPEWDELAGEVPWGSIMVAPTSELKHGRCLPRGEPGAPRPWRVVFTGPTLGGWGPLLYDAALELATAEGGGLMSDRGGVSADALGVWSAYADRRSDVEALQLDVGREQARAEAVQQLTPDVWWDDCDQGSAITHMPWGWERSPLSRVYRKAPSVLPALRALKLLWEN